MMHRLILTAVSMCALAGVAQAQQFGLPAGCEAHLTIQSRDCQVTHYFTCDGDADGIQRRVDLNEEAVTYFGMIDHETQWIESHHVQSGHSERLAPLPTDAASFSELLDTDIDTYDFVTLSDEVGPTRYVGRDTLTGQTVQIDGIDLLQTTFDIRAYDQNGTEMWHSVGREFVSPQWRMFIGGISKITTPDDTFELDGSPVEFIFPGETGFLSQNPKYGCGEMLSKREIAQ